MLGDVLPVVDWFALIEIELELTMTWQISVACVVDILSNSKDEWIIEIVKLIMAELDVVLNTIAIQISDSSLPGFFGLLKLDEIEGLGAIDNVYEVSEFALSLSKLDVLYVIDSGKFHVLIEIGSLESKSRC